MTRAGRSPRASCTAAFPGGELSLAFSSERRPHPRVTQGLRGDSGKTTRLSAQGTGWNLVEHKCPFRAGGWGGEWHLMALSFQVHTLSLFKDRPSPQQFKGQTCVSSDASTPADPVWRFYCSLFTSYVWEVLHRHPSLGHPLGSWSCSCAEQLREVNAVL